MRKKPVGVRSCRSRTLTLCGKYRLAGLLVAQATMPSTDMYEGFVTPVLRVRGD